MRFIAGAVFMVIVFVVGSTIWYQGEQGRKSADATATVVTMAVATMNAVATAESITPTPDTIHLREITPTPVP